MKQKERSLSWTRTLYLLVALVLVSLALILLSQGKQLGPVEGAVNAVITPVQQFTRDVTTGIGSWIDTLGNAQRLEEENRRLREAYDAAIAENARLQQADLENIALREALKFQTERPDITGVLANNIGGDPSSQREILTIDRGSDNGIKQGMAVLSPSGIMVGTIDDVRQDRATVLLVTDQESRVPVTTQRTQTPGILEGMWQHGGVLRVTHIPRDADVAKDDWLLTSGLGGTFPRGILIGQISVVHQDDVQTEKSADALPLVEMYALESVLVVTNEGAN
ncbi:MAG: rod shape-determining protein MreC [Chloroflexota bacterium]|nr:rod shape-determining protein MreC [Chloroflexota bacterium]